MELRLSFCNATLVLLIFFAKLYTSSAAVVNKKIFDESNICVPVKFLITSSYAERCNEILYPKDYKDDKILAMCMTVLDIANKICSYVSVTHVPGKPNDIKIPKNSKEFDAEIKALEPKSKKAKDFKEDLCKNMTSIFITLNYPFKSDPKIVPYVDYANKTLLTNSECPFTCRDIGETVNPICMIFLWASKLFKTMKPLPINEVPPIQEEKKLSHQEKVVKNTIEKTSIMGNGNIHNDEVLQQKVDNVVQPPVISSDDKQDLPAKNVPEFNAKNEENSKMKTVPHENSKTKLQNDNPELENQPKDKLPETKNKNLDNPQPPIPNEKENPNIPIDDENMDKKEGEFVQKKEDPNDDKKVDENGHKKEDENEDKKVDVNDDDSNEESLKQQVQNEIKNGNDDIENSINNNKKENNQDERRDQLQSGNSYFQNSFVKVEDESHFFTYFSILSLICVGLYIGYHNKQKILAILLEGRRSRRGRGSRRRPSTASYRKLDCNLEEAVTSQCNSNVTHVIY